MNRHPNPLIAQLAANLQPVRVIQRRDGLLLVALVLSMTVVSVELLHGLWRGAWVGQASAFFVITNGLLLVLGCASAHSVITMVSPRVGGSHDGPKWALVMLGVLPLAALLSLLDHDHAVLSIGDPYGLGCFAKALLASTLTALALVAWLRRGAPVSPTTAGLYVGVASTALGSVAYGLACPLDGVVHLGIWHVAPVLAGALLGRFLLPWALRW